MSELLKQAKKALAQKEKVIEMMNGDFSDELIKLPLGVETTEKIRYLAGACFRKDRVSYQLEKAVISDEERRVLEDRSGGET